MKKLTIHEKATIKAEGKLNSAHCKPVICIETGEVFSSVNDAAEAYKVYPQNMSTHLTGSRRHIKGKHFCYLHDATANLDAIVTRLREASEMEAKAKVYDAMMAEQEAARKAEEKRRADIAKAKEEVQRLSCELEAAKNKLEALEAEGEGETEVT